MEGVTEEVHGVKSLKICETDARMMHVWIELLPYTGKPCMHQTVKMNPGDSTFYRYHTIES